MMINDFTRFLFQFDLMKKEIKKKLCSNTTYFNYRRLQNQNSFRKIIKKSKENT